MNISSGDSFFNNYPYTNYHELNLDYILSNMAELKKSIDGLLESAEKYTDDEIQKIREYVDTSDKALNNLITILSSKVDENYSINIAYTDKEIVKNNEYIISEVSKNFELIKVINYFTGEEISVQNMFNFLAELHATDAIDYSELENRALSYSHIVTLQALYRDIATKGKEILINE